MKNQEEYHEKRLDRLSIFVDAVLAIIMTLLVLDLRVPVLTEINSTEEMMKKLSDILPHFYAFLLCFLAVTQFWLGSNVFFSLMVKYDNTMALLIVLRLLTYCLLPFSAAIIGQYPNNPGSFVIFGGLYFCGTILSSVSLKYYWRKEIFSADVNFKLVKDKIMKWWWLSPLIVILMISSAFINTKLSLVLFISMLLLWVYMTKQMKLAEEGKQGC
jgi:uncharacterized membrane protein